MERWLLRAGVLAPLLYACAVVVGAAATPGYSHAADTISELVGIDALRKALLDPVLMAASFLGIGYGMALLRFWPSLGRGLVLPAGGVTAVAVLSFLILLFPVDGRPLPRPPSEQVHIVLTGCVLLLVFATPLLFAVGARRVTGWGGLRLYSMATAVVILVAGSLTAIGEPRDWPLLGLTERFAIGPYLLWMLVTALAALRRHPSTGRRSSRPVADSPRGAGK